MGKPTRALLTAMDQPLGRAVGAEGPGGAGAEDEAGESGELQEVTTGNRGSDRLGDRDRFHSPQSTLDEGWPTGTNVPIRPLEL